MHDLILSIPLSDSPSAVQILYFADHLIRLRQRNTSVQVVSADLVMNGVVRLELRSPSVVKTIKVLRAPSSVIVLAILSSALTPWLCSFVLTPSSGALCRSAARRVWAHL